MDDVISRMYIVLVATSLLLLICPKLKAQDSASFIEIKSLTKIKLTFIGVAVEREQKVSPLTSIYIGASLNSVFLFDPVYVGSRGPDILDLEALLGIGPVFYAGFRKYSNLNERKNTNKKTVNNSANYLGLEISGITPMESPNAKYKTTFTMSLAPHWGMQRSLAKKVNFECAFGPSIKTNFETTGISIFGKIGLSFLL